MYKKILAIDPSGNFNEGKGTTGWVLLTKHHVIIDCGELKAKDYEEPGAYWAAHKALIDKYITPNVGLVIEDFLLYAHKADNQINSRFETSQLLGVLKQHAYETGITLHFQKAQLVKRRWNDDVLAFKEYIFRDKETRDKRWRLFFDGTHVSKHIRDALRHALHYSYFYNKE